MRILNVGQSSLGTIHWDGGSDVGMHTERVTIPNWIGMVAAQKAEARKLFEDGRIVTYPNITGYYAQRLIAYWLPQLIAVNMKVLRDDDVARAITRNLDPSMTVSASRADWTRKWQAYLTISTTTNAIAKAMGPKQIGTTVSAAYWKVLDDVVLRGSSIAGTPSQWSMFKEAVQEAMVDAAKTGSEFVNRLVPWWWPWVKWGSLGLGVVWAIQKVRESRR